MPHIQMKNLAGDKIPSVTQVLKNLGWNSGPLMWWANNEGLAGRRLYSSTDAIQIGNVAHAMVEASINGEEFNLNEIDLENELKDKVNLCWDAWCAWQEQSKMKVVDAEVSLVSEKHQFGGTLDCVALLQKGGKEVLSILDIKTGKGPYSDQVCQVVAYAKLWEENNPETKIEEIHIMKLGKESGSFGHFMFPMKVMEPAWTVFKHALELHKLQKIMKKLV